MASDIIERWKASAC